MLCIKDLVLLGHVLFARFLNSPMSMESGEKNNEEFSSFRESLRKMMELEEGARGVQKGSRGKVVSARVEGFEGRGRRGSMVYSKRRVFESPGEYCVLSGGVRERVKALDADDPQVCLGVGESEGPVYVSVDEEQPETRGDGDVERREEMLKEISVEEIKRNLLAELELESDKSGIDMTHISLSSENNISSLSCSFANQDQSVTYVDSPTENNLVETSRMILDEDSRPRLQDTHYKISDLSKVSEHSHPQTPKIQHLSGMDADMDHSASRTGSSGTGFRTDPYICEESTVVEYRDPSETPRRGWFSQIREFLFCGCCGRQQ